MPVIIKKIKKLGKPKPIMCLMIITRRMNKPKNTDICLWGMPVIISLPYR